jgi:hypothetical protein
MIKSLMQGVGHGMGALGLLFALAVAIVAPVSGFMFLFYTGRFMALLLDWMPFIQGLVGTVLVVGLIVGLPTLAFRRTAAISSLAFGAIAWVFGISIWLTSLLIIYQIWGRLAVIVSAVVLPGLPLIAAVALGSAGEWTTIGTLLVSATIWGLALLGTVVASRRHERRL